MAPPIPSDSPVSFVLLGTACFVLYLAGLAIYRVYFHPLRDYPGPLLWRISTIPRMYHLVIGDLPFLLLEYVEKYGPTLRIAPNELLFNDPKAWKEIYGHRTGGALEMEKYNPKLISHLPDHVISAGRTEHGLLRRQLSHGFSEKSMREQAPIIESYVNLLIRRIYENGNNGNTPLNMREWYNWTTFDVIGDLGFGSSFDCLRDSAYHPWVKLVTSMIKELTIFRAMVGLGFRPISDFMYKVGLLNQQSQHLDIVKHKVEERMRLGFEKPDFMEGLIKKKDEWNMSIDKLTQNASLLILAGSETTATLLSGATFLLATNPDKLEKLTEEVRSAFNSEDEINLGSASSLNYMLACLNESFRRYPPVASELARCVPKGGATISGKFVAEGSAVSVWQWTINHDPRHWNKPMEFIPERWLGDPEHKNDQLEAVQPFSYGPRNCIGKNLAYAEMRLILAKIIYNFDISIADDSLRWLRDQKTYILWEKPALNIYMTPAARKSG
ncbi:hypothetical protein M426DRAFT_95514 [Hypoxylon sp. CI-4A]|nr:hypothetical protein M426DRAFT_95514 [Hypoxylon sp. CI-4A]